LVAFSAECARFEPIHAAGATNQILRPEVGKINDKKGLFHQKYAYNIELCLKHRFFYSGALLAALAATFDGEIR